MGEVEYWWRGDLGYGGGDLKDFGGGREVIWGTHFVIGFDV